VASLTTEPGGRRTIQFIGADGKRRSFRLGKMALSDAREIKGYLALA
jgi:hypothetical protein